MKKLSAIFVALLLVAVSAVSAFAAGINDNEQKVLDELKTSVKMQGTEMFSIFILSKIWKLYIMRLMAYYRQNN